MIVHMLYYAYTSRLQVNHSLVLIGNAASLVNVCCIVLFYTTTNTLHIPWVDIFILQKLRTPLFIL